VQQQLHPKTKTREATMSKATKPIRTYRVLYAVTRSEYYEIEAANPQDAEDRAFEEGELTSADATSVEACDVEQIKRPAPKAKGGGK
jgi:hypothetical protein